MSFEVVPASVPYWPEERQRALDAPVSELPELSDFERSEVRRAKLDEERYCRLHPLLRKYVLERQKRQGTQFGKWIEEVITPLGECYKLVSLRRNGKPSAWRVTIRNEDRGLIEFDCLLETVDAITEGRASYQDRENLRLNILDELEGVGHLGATG